jgi:hypothetical protein
MLMLGIVVCGLFTGPVAAQSAEPFLSFRQDAAPPGLSLAAQKSTELVLALPSKANWTDVNIGHLAVRGHGDQRILQPAEVDGRTVVQHTFQESGVYLVALSVGPPDARLKSDAWQQVTICSKLIVTVGDGSEPPRGGDRLRAAGLSAKVGQRFEIVPLVSPVAMKVGSDLPVRAFFDFEKLVEWPLTAIRPDGSAETKNTDAVGAAHFRIDQPGRWILRFEKPLDGLARTAELVFNVEGGGRP